MPPFTIGSAVARPGEKVSGFITVPARADPGTEIPVTIIAGVHLGPVLALIAGIHGSEPSPIQALQCVRAEVDAAARGTRVTSTGSSRGGRMARRPSGSHTRLPGT